MFTIAGIPTQEDELLPYERMTLRAVEQLASYRSTVSLATDLFASGIIDGAVLVSILDEMVGTVEDASEEV